MNIHEKQQRYPKVGIINGITKFPGNKSDHLLVGILFKYSYGTYVNIFNSALAMKYISFMQDINTIVDT